MLEPECGTANDRQVDLTAVRMACKSEFSAHGNLRENHRVMRQRNDRSGVVGNRGKSLRYVVARFVKITDAGDPKLAGAHIDFARLIFENGDAGFAEVGGDVGAVFPPVVIAENGVDGLGASERLEVRDKFVGADVGAAEDAEDDVIAAEQNDFGVAFDEHVDDAVEIVDTVVERTGVSVGDEIDGGVFAGGWQVAQRDVVVDDAELARHDGDAIKHDRNERQENAEHPAARDRTIAEKDPIFHRVSLMARGLTECFGFHATQ